MSDTKKDSESGKLIIDFTDDFGQLCSHDMGLIFDEDEIEHYAYSTK